MPTGANGDTFIFSPLFLVIQRNNKKYIKITRMRLDSEYNYSYKAFCNLVAFF